MSLILWYRHCFRRHLRDEKHDKWMYFPYFWIIDITFVTSSMYRRMMNEHFLVETEVYFGISFGEIFKDSEKYAWVGDELKIHSRDKKKSKFTYTLWRHLYVIISLTPYWFSRVYSRFSIIHFELFADILAEKMLSSH